MGIEYDSRDPIFDSDREYWKANWFDNDGDGYVTGYAETVGISFYGYTVFNPDYNGETFDPMDSATWQVLPGNDCPFAQPGGEPFNNGFIGAMKADLVFGPDTGFYCGYAYALVAANRAGLERLNSYVSAEYELTDDITVFADVDYRSERVLRSLRAACGSRADDSWRSAQRRHRRTDWLLPLGRHRHA